MIPRKVSASGVKFLADCEGCRLRIYDDKTGKQWDGKTPPLGNLTIGVGHLLTAQDIITGRYSGGLTREQAYDLLARDLTSREALVCTRIKPELGRHQFDALVAFVFNWGHVPPELADAINAGHLDELTVRPLWMACTRAGGDPKALTFRRSREFALWLEPDPGPDGPSLDQVMAQVYLVADTLTREALDERPDCSAQG